MGIPAKIKANIWSNEYIDFGILISSHSKTSSGYHLYVSEKKDSPGLPALMLEPNLKVKNIANIEA